MPVDSLMDAVAMAGTGGPGRQTTTASTAGEGLFADAIFRLQYSLGGRVDDVSKAQTMNLVPNMDISNQNLSIITKLPWSKND